MFVVQAKDQGFQACVGGRLTLAFDAQRMVDYWNPVVAAWYPEGQHDPRLTLLCLDAVDAQVWLSETNPAAFGFQIAKANMTGREPDVGESAPISLDHRVGNTLSRSSLCAPVLGSAYSWLFSQTYSPRS